MLEHSLSVEPGVSEAYVNLFFSMRLIFFMLTADDVFNKALFPRCGRMVACKGSKRTMQRRCRLDAGHDDACSADPDVTLWKEVDSTRGSASEGLKPLWNCKRVWIELTCVCLMQTVSLLVKAGNKWKCRWTMMTRVSVHS